MDRLRKVPKSWPQMRLHPEGSSLYYEVVVYPSAATMRRYERQPRGVKGVVRHQRVWKNGRMQPQLGRMALCLQHLGVRVVSHEMGHVAMGFLYSRGEDELDLKEPNERLCYLIGDLTAAFYRWAYAKELIAS